MPNSINKTILLVDDEELLREIIREILTESGYRVIEVPDGPAALAHLQSSNEEVHLLISDIMMPKMDGRVLAEHAITLRPGLKVILMSGNADHGANPFGFQMVEKPFEMKALLTCVRAVLSGANPQSA